MSGDIPKTRYAIAADGAHIAYQVVGDGPNDLVYVPGWSSRLEMSWEQPLDARFLRSLAASTRLILVDRRGSGRSDPLSGDTPLSLGARLDDLGVVLDAVGSERAALLGVFEGGPPCTLFAATYPARTRALVLYASYARGSWAPDYPWAWTDEEMEDDIAAGERSLREGSEEDFYRAWMEETVPTLASEADAHPWLRKLFDISNPGSAITLTRFEHATDIRAVLPTIQVPTLVINRTGDRVADLEEGRWVAGQIPGARFVELPGIDHPPWAGDQGAILETITAFLGVELPPAETDRVLATVLMTDIVDSTRRAAELGDGGWADLIATHDERAKAQIARFAGRFVDSAGDGVFATFDGPARAVRCAEAIDDAIRDLGIQIRAGCHTGEVELAGDKVRGIAVHIGARIAAMAEPGEVLVSSTVRDLVVGSGLAFDDAGEHELKGVPSSWHLYRVVEPTV
jgi:class 3 adenylate cyclase